MSQQKFILVANIGNRNLIYKGLEEIDKNIYRSTTQKYWQTYENSNGDIEVLADLQVSILPILLNKLLGEEDLLIDRLVLFSSNQLGINGVDNNKETKQDTLYAGKIIQALLKYDERYKIYREAIKFFEVKEIKASVIKPNQLIVNYQKQLKTLGDSYPDHLFIICDSGGTSQQKTSLKIAAEYLFDRDKYTYPNTEGYRYQSWYVKESTGNNGIIQLDKGEVIPSDVDEYRKIIDKRQIELLIKKGNYNAAAQIRENTEMNKNGLHKVLKFCAYRKRLLLQDAKDLYKVIGSEEDDFDDTNGRFRQVDDFIEEEPLGHFNRSLSKENNGWQDCLSKSHFRTVCETLAIADFHYLLGQWTDFVLASQVFIETYLSAFISHNTPFDIINNFEEDSKAYYKKGSSLPTSLTCKKNEQYDSFFQHTINEATYKTKSKKEKKEWALLFNWSVPCRFRFVEKFKNAPQHQLLIQTFKHYHSALMPTPKRKKFGIDKLRNKIAHKGIGVNNEKTINEYLLKSQDLPSQEQVLKSNSILALLSNWIELLEFKEETNVYLRMNETVISYLKKE